MAYCLQLQNLLCFACNKLTEWRDKVGTTTN